MAKNSPIVSLLSFMLCASSVVTTTSLSGQAQTPAIGISSRTLSYSALPAASDLVGTPTALPNARKTPASGKLENNVTTEPDAEEVETDTVPVSSKISRRFVRSDFEIFADDASGIALEVFGRKLFEETPSTFAPVDRIPVPADYAIGPGDELLIRAWGKIDLDTHVTVDRNGEIYLPKVGTLDVAGLRYAQLEGFLRTEVGNLFKGFELNVTLGKLRSIQIMVLGHARQPGSYTVGSLTTLVDAIFATGGPSSSGTMRHIQLRRGDRIVTEFDLYDLQQKGDKSHDVQLLPGDEIYIPPIGSQVAIVGSVNEPGIFELKDNTTIASALEGAGGVTTLAATDRVLLERIANHRMRRVEELTLNARDLERLLRDGDLLRISPISSHFENAVTIRGNIAAPGRFPWHESMRVSDLIPSRAFLLTSDHWNQQNHLADERHTDMIADIAATNAEINWNYAAIERLDDHDLSTRLIAFNLSNAIDDPASSDNQLLKVGDILTIFSRKDLPLPLEKHATFVQVGGEVNAPGVYRINPGDTLRDLVARAGGLTTRSYLYASQLTRAATRHLQEEQLKLSLGRLQKELSSKYANSSHTIESANTSQAANGRISEQAAQFSAQRTLISELSTAQPTGRVVLGISTDAAGLGDIPEFPLEDGDSFYIPPKLGTIQVVGEVYNENAFRYQVKKPLNAYLDDSGGATRMADVKRIFLIRADGTVVSRQSHGQHWLGNFEKIALMPGDAIIVPPKLKTSATFMEELPLITQMVSQTAMTGAVLSLMK